MRNFVYKSVSCCNHVGRLVLPLISGEETKA